MKTFFKFLLPVLLVIVLVAAADKPPGRIATIDLGRAFEKYYLYDQAMKAVEQEKAGIMDKLNSMQDEGRKIVEERDKLRKDMSDPMITAQERESLRSRVDAKNLEIDAKKSEMSTYQQHAQDQLLLKEDHVREQLLKDIRAAVDAKAKAAGYSLVINSAAIVYDSKENDITDEILKQINAAAPTTAPAADPLKTAGKPDK